MSNFNAAGGGLQYRGTNASAPPNCSFEDRDPTQYDWKGYSLMDLWLNKNRNAVWILVSLQGTSTSKGTLATWIELTANSNPGILSLTGNDAVTVFPNSAGNINVIGAFPLSVAGTTHTETISVNLGTQTPDGVAYGQGTSSVIGWTGAGASNTVLIGTGGAPQFSSSPSVNSITILNAPVNPTDGTNKEYVDSIASGFGFFAPTRVATTANLTATYNNGAAGVGATLTNSGTQVALAIDGVTLSVADRVLVKNQTSQAQNGIYVVSNTGSGATNWVLTRSTDYNTAPNPIKPGNLVPVISGTVNAASIWMQIETVTTIGTDPIVFVPFGSSENENIIITNYTTPGTFTWTKNANTQTVQVYGWAGGAGGGSGGSGTGASGGAGGGSGGAFTYNLPATFIPATVSVVVGAGGTGGASTNSGTGFGFAGTAGGASQFGSITTCQDLSVRNGGSPAPQYGGGGVPTGASVQGTSGTLTSNIGYAAAVFVRFSPSSGYFDYMVGGQAGSTVLLAPVPSNTGSMMATCGGAGGGPAVTTGGQGASILSPLDQSTLIAGGAPGNSGSANGSNGANASTSITFLSGGTGGGGGGYASGVAGNGGNGGFPGGGGGGGAGSTAGNASGAGGNGGNGQVIVIEYL